MALPLACARTESSATTSTAPSSTTSSGAGADVVTVATSGDAGSYQFSVTLKSPDSGCDRYADWWEVVTAEGELVYRRILAHSHVDEQPFTRSGGPVDVTPEDALFVRAHMSAGGYAGTAQRGTVADGFALALDVAPDFASQLALSPPLPDGCAF
jgi:hypothetical protein